MKIPNFKNIGKEKANEITKNVTNGILRIVKTMWEQRTEDEPQEFLEYVEYIIEMDANTFVERRIESNDNNDS